MLPPPVTGKGRVVREPHGRLSPGQAVGGGTCVQFCTTFFSAFKVIFSGQVKTCSPWSSVFLCPLSGLEAFSLQPFSSGRESRPVDGNLTQGFAGQQDSHFGRGGGARWRCWPCQSPHCVGPVTGGSAVSSSASLGSFLLALLAEWFVSQGCSFLLCSVGRSASQVVEKSQ